MAADAEATLPSLIEETKRQITADRKRALAGSRRQAGRSASASAGASAHGRDRMRGTRVPISTGRLCAELWAQIKDEDWSLVSILRHFSWWPLRLWPFDKHYQYIGTQGGGGIGYNAPASSWRGAREQKVRPIFGQHSGRWRSAVRPAVLWTAAHHRIPLLSVMHNNRAYHEELMHVQRMANRHNRGIDRAGIGTTFEDPKMDFASSRKAWASTPRARSRTPTNLPRP